MPDIMQGNCNIFYIFLQNLYIFPFFTNNNCMNTAQFTPYSDLAFEFSSEYSLPHKSYKKQGILVKEVNLDDHLARRLGRRAGQYITLEWTKAMPVNITTLLSSQLKTMSTGLGLSSPQVLCIGLGNPNFLVDRLGTLCLDNLTISPHSNLTKLYPSIESVTGISSFDMISAVVQKIKPNLVIVIDTLATYKLSRIGSCIQLTTAGISPGGGVGNDQPHISRTSLNVPVIAVGVPLLISLGSIFKDCDLTDKELSVQVMPKDVDKDIQSLSSIIAQSITQTFAKS